MSFLKGLFKSRLFLIVVLVLVIAAIPLTVFIAQQQQETRQHASGNAIEATATAECEGNNPRVHISWAPPAEVQYYAIYRQKYPEGESTFLHRANLVPPRDFYDDRTESYEADTSDPNQSQTILGGTQGVQANTSYSYWIWLNNDSTQQSNQMDVITLDCNPAPTAEPTATPIPPQLLTGYIVDGNNILQVNYFAGQIGNTPCTLTHQGQSCSGTPITSGADGSSCSMGGAYYAIFSTASCPVPTSTPIPTATPAPATCTGNNDCPVGQNCYHGTCDIFVCSQARTECQTAGTDGHTCTVNKPDGTTCSNGTCQNGDCVQPTNTPVPHRADVNRDGNIDNLDFNIIADAIRTGTTQPNTYPDINSDGKVNLLDYNLWFRKVQGL